MNERAFDADQPDSATRPPCNTSADADRSTVWAARITPEKCLHLAIDAVRETDLQLEISGPIADRSAVRARAQAFDAVMTVDRYEQLMEMARS